MGDKARLTHREAWFSRKEAKKNLLSTACGLPIFARKCTVSGARVNCIHPPENETNRKQPQIGGTE
jgi:hypothetical protein